MKTRSASFKHIVQQVIGCTENRCGVVIFLYRWIIHQFSFPKWVLIPLLTLFLFLPMLFPLQGTVCLTSKRLKFSTQPQESPIQHRKDSSFFRSPNSESYIFQFLLLTVVFVLYQDYYERDNFSFHMLLFCFLSAILVSRVPLFRKFIVPTIFNKVFTQGEWLWVSFLIACFLTLLIRSSSSTPSTVSDLVFRISMYGILGTLTACWIMAHASFTTNNVSWAFRLLMLVGLPLILIQLVFAISTPIQHTVLQWFMLDFVPVCEPAVMVRHPACVPRIWMILYWLFLFPIMLWGAPRTGTISSSNRSPQHSITRARKWFHGMAVLLFAPATVYSPLLLSLAYAIAFCLLCLLDHVYLYYNGSQSWIHCFYHRYLDASKAETTTRKQWVVSHVALLGGCAIPLWIYLWKDPQARDPVDHTVDAILSLWGVIVLGVGDALGALVGTSWGRTYYSNGRTLEGSTAMCLGILLSYFVILDSVSLEVVFASILVTVLEACTTEMDNVVLPVVGIALFL